MMRTPSLIPPGESTGYGYPNCYMSATLNCSDVSSREHYISNTILQQFQHFTVAGLPWQPRGAATEIGPGSLTSRVLCERHNNALSPLDQAAGDAFRRLNEARTHASRRSLSRKTAHFLINGDALQLWGLKTILGFYYSGAAANEGGKVKDQFALQTELLVAALSEKVFPEPLGLYLFGLAGFRPQEKITFQPLLSPEFNALCAARIQIAGADLNFQVDTRMSPMPEFNPDAYRPWVADFQGPLRTGRVILSWSKQRFRLKKVGYVFTKRAG